MAPEREYNLFKFLVTINAYKSSLQAPKITFSSTLSSLHLRSLFRQLCPTSGALRSSPCKGCRQEMAKTSPAPPLARSWDWKSQKYLHKARRGSDAKFRRKKSEKSGSHCTIITNKMFEFYVIQGFVLDLMIKL